MTFGKLSKKQMKVLKWWIEPCLADKYDTLICDGAVRSGKTTVMIMSFVLWAMESFDNHSFGICGKTVRSAERNIILPLTQMTDLTREYIITYTRSANLLTIARRDKKNYFYVFGGRDESSYMLIQGITLAGVFFDEVALMPESFVNQAIARTLSISNRRLWFNCNPENPGHWFYRNWIKEPDKKNAVRLRFAMRDNPMLTESDIRKAESLYTGVFYERYILGEWTIAEGLVYDMWNDSLLYDTPPPRLTDTAARYIAVDYGTVNPTVFLDIYDDGQTVWVAQEYYYDSHAKQVQRDDTQYAADLDAFAKGEMPNYVIVDPSAASFKVALRNRGYRVKDADNSVNDGIRVVSSLLARGLIRVHRRCENLRNEFAAYRWDDKARERGIEQVIKQSDHALDALRYYVKTIVHKRRF